MQSMIPRLHGWLLAGVSGVLQVVAFAPWEGFQSRHQWSFVAWVAWMPVISRLIPVDPTERVAGPVQMGFIMGLVFWLGTIFWLSHVSVAAMLSLATYQALFSAAWTFLLSRLVACRPAITGLNHLKLALAGASAWVALEWLRGWLFGGFPWNFAAVTQYQNLALIQVAEWTGVYGVSFLVLYVNLSLWFTWRRLKAEHFSARSWRYEFSVAILLVAFCLMIGMRHLLAAQRQVVDAVSLKIALVQPNIPQELKYEAMSQNEQQERLAGLTLDAGLFHPDLVVWPETALVDGPNIDSRRRPWLRDLVQRVRSPLLFGTLDTTAPTEGALVRGQVAPNYYNAVMFLGTDGTLLPPYHKLHLVPFGEFVPLERWLPWLRHLTPIQGSFTPGEQPVCFEIKGLRMGPLICFEDTIPSLSRRLSRGGADVLVNLTNDAWFRHSPGAALHGANAVFRTVENRRPLVRCSNSGMTCVIDADGKVLGAHQPFVNGFQIMTASFRRQPPVTFYARWGDWCPLACGLIALVGLLQPRNPRCAHQA